MFDYNQQLAQAQQNYNQMIQGYQTREANVASQSASLGQNQLDQANRYYDQQSQAARSSAVTRGLGNTTISDSLQNGVNAQRGIDLAQINNNIAGQKLQYGMQASGDTLNAMQQGQSQLMGYGFTGEQLRQAALNSDRQYTLGQGQLGVQQGQLGIQQQQLGYQMSQNPYAQRQQDQQSLQGWYANHFSGGLMH